MYLNHPEAIPLLPPPTCGAIVFQDTRPWKDVKG